MTVVKCNSLFCIVGVFFLLLAPCICLQIQLASSHFDHGTGNKVAEVCAETFLPRKRRVLNEKVTFTVKENTEKDADSKKYNPYKRILSEKKEAKPRPGQGQTRKQWMDDDGDSSEFFTMDYSRVRRRRPIHNKGLPVSP